MRRDFRVVRDPSERDAAFVLDREHQVDHRCGGLAVEVGRVVAEPHRRAHLIQLGAHLGPGRLERLLLLGSRVCGALRFGLV